jgi:hypothetical protein
MLFSVAIEVQTSCGAGAFEVRAEAHEIAIHGFEAFAQRGFFRQFVEDIAPEGDFHGIGRRFGQNAEQKCGRGKGSFARADRNGKVFRDDLLQEQIRSKTIRIPRRCGDDRAVERLGK